MTKAGAFLAKIREARPIARKIPSHPPSGPMSDVAAEYGLTVAEFRQAYNDFLQGEGYDTEGNKYDSLHDWLVRSHGEEQPDRTPWQKGDLDWDGPF